MKNSSAPPPPAKSITIGVLPEDKIRERILAVAKGELKFKPSDPKVWFTSMPSPAEVSSDENRALLRTIWQSKPASIAELAMEAGASRTTCHAH